MLQVAKGHYAPDAYHDYIGFQVAQPLLERAFEETYSIELKSIFTNYDLAVATYRLYGQRVNSQNDKSCLGS